MKHYYVVPQNNTPPKPRVPLAPLIEKTPRDLTKGYAKNRRGSPKTPPAPPVKHPGNKRGLQMLAAAQAIIASQQA